MTHPPCLRLCPAHPGNPRSNIEGESPLAGKGHTVFETHLTVGKRRLLDAPQDEADKARARPSQSSAMSSSALKRGEPARCGLSTTLGKLRSSSSFLPGA